MENGSFFKIGQTPPRCDFTGMAVDLSSFVGEAVQKEKTSCNDQYKYDEKVGSVRSLHSFLFLFFWPQRNLRSKIRRKSEQFLEIKWFLFLINSLFLRNAIFYHRFFENSIAVKESVLIDLKG